MPRRSSTDGYTRRIHAVLDHIRADPAARHGVEDLARVACFSPFHFHRVFTSIVGETVGDHVRRIRLERAVALMKAAPARPLSRIAVDAGFAALADFSRAFRRRYGMPPGRWDRHSPLTEFRKNGQADDPCRRYTDDELAEADRNGEFDVRLLELPERRVVYLRIADSYTVENVLHGYRTFIAWLRDRFGELPEGGTLIGMSHDDPEVTPAALCRYDFCWTIDDDVKTDGPIAIRTMPACTVAALHIDGDIGRLSRGWDWLYGHWLPRSRWQPAHLPAMEIYRRTPEVVGWEWFDLDGCIPVEPL